MLRYLQSLPFLISWELLTIDVSKIIDADQENQHVNNSLDDSIDNINDSRTKSSKNQKILNNFKNTENPDNPFIFSNFEEIMIHIPTDFNQIRDKNSTIIFIHSY